MVRERGEQIYRFADFALDANEHRLQRGEQEIYLRPKTFETLIYLIGRHGHLVTKDELLDNIWHDTIVTEATVAHCIEEIRKALGDDAHHPQYLKTIPRVGYKFIGRVDKISPVIEEEVIEEYTELRVRVTEEEQSGEIDRSLPASYAISPDVPSIPKILLFKKLNLKTFVFILLLFIVIIMARYLSFEHHHAIDSLAVLPFTNLSADPAQEYFVDGMTEAIITNLAKINGLKVISRTSMMRYKESKKSIPEIAHELKVAAVVEGSVLQTKNRVRVNAQLIHGETDQHLWAESYERDLNNILVLQGDVSGSIANAIQAKLTPHEQQRLTLVRPIDPTAYHAYLKGRYFWNKRTEEGFKKGIEYFEQAIDIDTTYAQAHAGLADCYNLLYDFDLSPPKEAAPKARSAAITALTIDTTLAEAHASLGFVTARYDWNWQDAEREFQRAIELNNNYSIAYHWYALHLAMMGRFEEATREITKARELDPLSLIVNTNVGWILYFAGRYDEAEQQLTKTLEMDPDFLSAHVKLGWVYEQKGLYQQAIAEFRKAHRLARDDANVIALLSNSYAVTGNKAEALELLNQVKAQSRQKYISAYWIALIYTSLDDKDQAFEWLNKAVEERSGGLVWLKVEPGLERLRTDPRFTLILQNIKFR